MVPQSISLSLYIIPINYKTEKRTIYHYHIGHTLQIESLRKLYLPEKFNSLEIIEKELGDILN